MRSRLVMLVALLAGSSSISARITDIQATYQDAYVEHDSASDQWTIGNDAISYTIDIDRDRSLRLIGLKTVAFAEPVTQDAAPDAVVDLGDQIVRLGEAGSGFMVDRAEA